MLSKENNCLHHTGMLSSFFVYSLNFFCIKEPVCVKLVQKAEGAGAWFFSQSLKVTFCITHFRVLG